MKAWVAAELSGPDALELREVPRQEVLGPGQVRVRIRSASLNARDRQILAGHYAQWTVPSLIPLSDGAGEVIEIGPEVWRVQDGERVVLTFDPTWMGGPWEPTPFAVGRGGGTQGVLREEIVVYQDELVPIPAHLSFNEAATLPCAAVTAWSALTLGALPLPGETVLVQGTGGVSIFALQLAKLFGLRVIATSSSDERCAFLKALGADETINYRQFPHWSEQILRLTGGGGVDRIVEIGGEATIAQSFEAVRMGGRVSLVGLVTGLPQTVPGLFARGATTGVVRVGSRADFVAMNRAISYHRLRPVIHSTYAFSQAKQALLDFGNSAHIGKIVVSMD